MRNIGYVAELVDAISRMGRETSLSVIPHPKREGVSRADSNPAISSKINFLKNRAMENEKSIVTNDFFAGKLPDLEKMECAPLELSGEYWTPENVGESKRMFFNEIRYETTTDPASGNEVELPVAYFVILENGNKKVIRQASRRLTGVIESLNIAQGTPLEITYQGKKKNKTNPFMSDHWSIRPLIIK